MNKQSEAPTYPVTADYIISLGNNFEEVFAVSGKKGCVVAKGTDAAMVIQEAIDALPTEGGHIYISSGSYQLNSTITIEDKHGVHLHGAARGIVFSGGKEGTVLRSDRDIDLIEVFGNSLKVAGITVSNLHLVGSGKKNGKAGILVHGTSDLLSLHNVGVNHCGVGFHLRGGGGKGGGVVDAPQIQFCDPQLNGVGLKIERGHYAKVMGGEFSDCDEFGILLSSPETGYARNQGIKILGVTGVRNPRAGIVIGRNTEDTTVAGGCDFAGVHSGSGIVISDEGSGEKPRNVIISGIHVYNNRDAGILVESASHVVIQGCICSGHDHVVVDDPGQQHGINIKDAVLNIVVNGNVTYGNRAEAILDETERAVVVNNSDG